MIELLEKTCISDDGNYMKSAILSGNANNLFHNALVEMLNLAFNSYDKYYQYKLIDLVLVIVDGNGKDLGTTFILLNDVVLPHIPNDRVLVAINKADFAMKGRHWNPTTCQPIYYSAEYGYNVDVLLDFIIENMPYNRRSSR